MTTANDYRAIYERTGHSLYNLEPMAQLAHHPHRVGFHESICLPGGEYRVLELVKSVPRPDGTFCLVWQRPRPMHVGKRGYVGERFVTSTALQPAIPFAKWEERMLRTRSLL